MKKRTLAVCVLALTLAWSGVSLKNFGLQFGGVALAQMFKSEPAVEPDGETRVLPDATDASSSPSRKISSTLGKMALSVQRQGPNLIMSLSLAAMLLMLVGFWFHHRRRQRASDQQGFCKCGRVRAHCPWCSKGES